MKNSFVKYGILLVMSMAAVFIAKAGHPAFAMWILAMYAAVLICLSEYRQDKEAAQTRRLEERLADEVARECHLGEALVLAATEAMWVETVVETSYISSYIISVPSRGRIVVHLPNEDASTKNDEDAAGASERADAR